MKPEEQFMDKIESMQKRFTNTINDMRQMESLNKSYFQSAMNAIYLDNQKEIGKVLKNHRKLWRTVSGMERTERESFDYECGIFIGACNALEEIERINKRRNRAGGGT